MGHRMNPMIKFLNQFNPFTKAYVPGTLLVVVGLIFATRHLYLNEIPEAFRSLFMTLGFIILIKLQLIHRDVKKSVNGQLEVREPL